MDADLVRFLVDKLELLSWEGLRRAGTSLITPAPGLVSRRWLIRGLRRIVLEASIECGRHVEPWVLCSSDREGF
jgi:hypothetical protein